MIVLTGAAGFIGSCLLSYLNKQGHSDIIIIDEMHGDDDLKWKNLEGKKYIELIDKEDFLARVMADDFSEKPTLVLHMGACSSTTGTDKAYYQHNNLDYSIHMAQWALKHGARFIYASSAATYGDGEQGYDDDPSVMESLKPLNIYGQSKQDFDLWVKNQGLMDQVVGLKFFNVFGPNEYHKGEMKSVIAKSYERVVNEGVISLFKSYRSGYADGEQKRDFIYVKDVLNVIHYFIENPSVNGIYNVGTGEARTWKDLALALFAAVGKNPRIEFVDMPEHLKERYQYFTQANMSRLKKVGYTKSFTSLEDAVKDYVVYLKDNACF